jgi:hypothetical protein
VVFVARMAADGVGEVERPSASTVLYRLTLHHHQGAGIRLKAIAGPGGDGKLVVTILLPHED